MLLLCYREQNPRTWADGDKTTAAVYTAELLDRGRGQGWGYSLSNNGVSAGREGVGVRLQSSRNIAASGRQLALECMYRF